MADLIPDIICTSAELLAELTGLRADGGDPRIHKAFEKAIELQRQLVELRATLMVSVPYPVVTQLHREQAARMLRDHQIRPVDGGDAA